MSLYEPTFHVTPVDLCIILQCNSYIYPVSCLVEIKSFQIISHPNSYHNRRGTICRSRFS